MPGRQYYLIDSTRINVELVPGCTVLGERGSMPELPLQRRLRERPLSFRMSRLRPDSITLRRTVHADVPRMYAIGIDQASNTLAGTKPRTWPEFEARWNEILADVDATATRVTPRVILVDGDFVGSVNIFPQDDRDSIGYWIARDHWGRGIATRAVALILEDFTLRPLYASAAATNAPSIRVLTKNGFEIVSRVQTPETIRTVQRETVTLVLR